jgi:trehalose 6-phosphate phosphatase
VIQAWVEDKGASLAVHYREAPDPAGAELMLAEALAPLAVRTGLELIKGKKVMELAPAETPGKGAVVREQVLVHGLLACLYAGDDLSDLDAFEALAELRPRGVEGVRVAVRSAEAPAALLGAADLVVGGPQELIDLLALLAG